MSFDPLLTALGLVALATPTTAAVFAPNNDRAGINIQPGSGLPISNPVVGDLYIDALGWVRVSAQVVGTSFTITSSSGTDTSQIAWLIVEGF